MKKEGVCGVLHFECCDTCFNQDRADGGCAVEDQVEGNLKMVSDRVLCGMYNKES